MKRWIYFLLACAMLLPLFTSCASEDTLSFPDKTAEVTKTEESKKTAEATETEPAGMTPQNEREKSITKILIIGNSSSNDVFFQLGRVFNAQGFGGKKYVLGFLYYSGCKFSQHVDFMKRNDPVYDYYTTSETGYICEELSTMKHALRDQQWDVILLHPGGADDILHKDLKKSFRRQIEEYVNLYVPTEHVFGFHLRSSNPTEDALFSNDWWRKPPAGYRDNLIRAYGSIDYTDQLVQMTDAVKTHILTDPLYEVTICTGTAFHYAHKVLGVSQFDLYRDYTHLSDFGRVLAAYAFYAQFTGEPIDEVKLERVPAHARQSHYQAEGDLIITEDLKRIIKESVNNTLEHPFDVPAV